jgi:hypothetical protein
MSVRCSRGDLRIPMYAQRRMATGGQIQLSFLPILRYSPSISQDLADPRGAELLSNFCQGRYDELANRVIGVRRFRRIPIVGLLPRLFRYICDETNRVSLWCPQDRKHPLDAPSHLVYPVKKFLLLAEPPFERSTLWGASERNPFFYLPALGLEVE